MQSSAGLSRFAPIPALTGLRFFAAFFVFFSHAFPKIIPLSPGWIYGQAMLYGVSTIGMMLFFVLSGFVIHFNYSAAIRAQPVEGIYNFLIARFARLYPLFFVGLLYDLIHHHGYSTLTHSFKQVIPYYLTLTQSWFYIPIKNTTLIFQFGLIPQVTWSISTEWFFYLTYPLICFFLLKMPRVRAQLLFMIIFSLMMYSLLILLTRKEKFLTDLAVQTFGEIANTRNGFGANSFKFWLVYFSPYFRIAEFILGCLTAAIYMRIAHIKPSRKEEYFGLIILSSAILGVFTLHFLAFADFHYLKTLRIYSIIMNFMTAFGYAPFLAAIIFCCARYNTILSRFLSRPSLLVCGEASYSIYLFHLVIIEAFSRDAALVTSWKVFAADGVRFLISFFAVLGMAILFYKGIEVPARKWIRKKLAIKTQSVAVAT